MFFEDFLMLRNGYNNNKLKGKILEELFIIEFGYLNHPICRFYFVSVTSVYSINIYLPK